MHHRASRPASLPLLGGLALARGALDRGAERRVEDGLVEALLGDGATRVLELRGGRAPVEEGPDGPRLRLRAPSPADAGADLVAYLGRDGETGGPEHVAVVRADDPDDPAPEGWAGLREVGAVLDDLGAALLTAGVALGNWHATHPRCPRCGTRTVVASAGWSRSCPADGSEHHPRTDPAVIMTVLDGDDRLLLGHQASWPERRYSTLAGFVEAGESLEQAVRREVLEESGVHVGEVEYRGSQPWPFPQSLMLGFHAWAVGEAVDVAVAVDGVEIVSARWWTREQLAADVAAGEVLLPPRVSIARRLVEDWYGEPLVGAERWR